MSSFAEVRLEDGLVIFATQGGPEFSTAIVTVNSGAEYRNATWSDSLSMWDLGDRKLTADELSSIVGFFRARGGKAQGFRLKDWSDYQATHASTAYKNSSSQGVLGQVGGPYGVGNSGLTYNTFKSYTSGSDTAYRQIKKLVTGTFKAYKNGTLMVVGGGTGQYAIDVNTGLMTIVTTAPTSGDTLTWEGEFDVPVRFDTDTLKQRFDSARVITAGNSSTPAILGDKFFYLNSLPLVELRNP